VIYVIPRIWKDLTKIARFVYLVQIGSQKYRRIFFFFWIAYPVYSQIWLYYLPRVDDHFGYITKLTPKIYIYIYWSRQTALLWEDISLLFFLRIFVHIRSHMWTIRMKETNFNSTGSCNIPFPSFLLEGTSSLMQSPSWFLKVLCDSFSLFSLDLKDLPMLLLPGDDDFSRVFLNKSMWNFVKFSPLLLCSHADFVLGIRFQ